MEVNEKQWRPVSIIGHPFACTCSRIMKYITAVVHIAFLLWVGSEVRVIRDFNGIDLNGLTWNESELNLAGLTSLALKSN